MAAMESDADTLDIPPRRNALGQPVGEPLPDWRPAAWPPRTPMIGRYCRLEPLDPAPHARGLYAAFAEDREGRDWTYLPYGPFPDRQAFTDWLHAFCRGDDPQFHTLIDRASGEARGMASYLRITPAVGVMEVGHIHLAPSLQRTAAATEAMLLMMRRAFTELGYRRYEWKCDALNAPSRAAAVRLGLRFEGVFRQATITKGRSRDTAWYSVIDREWPALERAFEAWLDPANFDAQGRQRRRLEDLRQR